MTNQLGAEQIEQFIKDTFEDNYRTMRLEGGHGLTPDIREYAFQQVLRYWQKLQHIAENVTDTEVPLVLPNQKTPKGRRYTIEGVVDILREQDRTVMYDIKTHDADYVRENRDLYEKQLNVYAHIWQELRGQPLDETAVIATSFPGGLEQAIKKGDPVTINSEMLKWDPVIPIPFDRDHVKDTIADFGKVVDAIEDKTFSAAPLTALQRKEGGSLFATRVCRNCDARFSCDSYRAYAVGARSRKETRFAELFATDEAERMTRVAVNVDAAPAPSEAD
jgi:PD-(D/E)XK nuclease superfamily protein